MHGVEFGSAMWEGQVKLYCNRRVYFWWEDKISNSDGLGRRIRWSDEVRGSIECWECLVFEMKNIMATTSSNEYGTTSNRVASTHAHDIYKYDCSLTTEIVNLLIGESICNNGS